MHVSVQPMYFCTFLKKLTVMLWRIALRFHWLNFKAYDKPWATGFKRYFRVKKVSFKFLCPWPFQSFEIKWAHFYHFELEVHGEFLYKILKKCYKPDTNACTYISDNNSSFFRPCKVDVTYVICMSATHF